jgi:hypothetical protein
MHDHVLTFASTLVDVLAVFKFNSCSHKLPPALLHLPFLFGNLFLINYLMTTNMNIEPQIRNILLERLVSTLAAS